MGHVLWTCWGCEGETPMTLWPTPQLKARRQEVTFTTCHIPLSRQSEHPASCQHAQGKPFPHERPAVPHLHGTGLTWGVKADMKPDNFLANLCRGVAWFGLFNGNETYRPLKSLPCKDLKFLFVCLFQQMRKLSPKEERGLASDLPVWGSKSLRLFA